MGGTAAMIGVLRSELFKLRTTRATKVVVACSIAHESDAILSTQ